ncbi:MAG: hypothetical protein LBQ54_09820 [Planctomycetaceae bacterium]|jgi:hypothetical protein|nr:hypothetical protein [Planctomycetaceae bacterium]
MKNMLSFLFTVLIFVSPNSVFGQNRAFVCEPAEDWTALLDRKEGWLAGDGIFTLGLEGDSRQGSAGENSGTLFLFSDSFFGSSNDDGTFRWPITMINHCVGVLEGNRPEQKKMRFLYNTDAEGKPSNLFDKHFWLGDGIVIDSILYTTGTVVDPKTWILEGVWMISVPIKNNLPDFTQARIRQGGLFHKEGVWEVLFGIGITDCGEDIYVYGFRDKKGEMFFPRQLVVAKAPRKSFGQVSTWQFWTGERWSGIIADCNCEEAGLAEGISNELSVTRMKGGVCDGKFILVYTKGCLGPSLNFAISESPYSKFIEEQTFYHCPEPERYEQEVKQTLGEKANVVTYNAKAHPRLSQPGELIVSYNLNVFGMKEGAFFTNKKFGFPRFVRLKFTESPHENKTK